MVFVFLLLFHHMGYNEDCATEIVLTDVLHVQHITCRISNMFTGAAYTNHCPHSGYFNTYQFLAMKWPLQNCSKHKNVLSLDPVCQRTICFVLN